MTRIALLTFLSTMAMACTAGRADRPPEQEMSTRQPPPSEAPPNGGGACAEGATRECVVVVSTTGDIKSCFKGVQSCVSGAWSACGSEPIQATSEEQDFDAFCPEGTSVKWTFLSWNVETLEGATVRLSVQARKNGDAKLLPAAPVEVVDTGAGDPTRCMVDEPGGCTKPIAALLGEAASADQLHVKVKILGGKKAGATVKAIQPVYDCVR
jgi:hypothetical protein